MRAYLEHGLAREPQPVKLWYFAPMFRYARAQRGRYREHWQFGVESLGSDDPAVDAEVIALQAAWFGELGLLDGLELRAQLDRRPRLPARPIASCSWPTSSASAASSPRTRRRASTINPLRIFDSKDEGDQQDRRSGAPRITDHLCADCAEHFARVRAFLDARGVAYRVTPELVRGLDYYERTAWEWVFPGGGAQAGTISGGGRYDGLAEQIGGERVPGVGFGCGTERVVLALEEAGVEPPRRVVDWFCACEDDAARPALHALLERARARGLAAQADLAGRSLKGQLRHAERAGRARRHGLPRRRRRAWHRQARRDRDRVRRCRGLRRAERAERVSAYRDMLCGEPRAEHAGRELTLSGWVGGRRDHGGLVFIDLRDRTGIVQLVMDPERSPEAHAMAHALRLECVVRARGQLVPRSEATRNDQLPTGDVELAVDELELLSSSEVLPFQLDDENVDEALRIRHRYLDLRRAENAGPAGHSHARGALDPPLPRRARLPRPRDADDDARDARGRARLRRSRSGSSPGTFYALPQSPQLYKQLLMCGGFDRYYQIARCWRDEAQRADRALEFTQLDLEMSFVEQRGRAHADRAADGRGLARRRARDRAAVPARARTARRSRATAPTSPTCATALEIGDVSAQVAGSEFGVFSRAVGGRRRRALPERARRRRGALAQGLRRARRVRQGVGRQGARVPDLRGRRERALADRRSSSPRPRSAAIREASGAEPGSVAFIAADAPAVVERVLGALRPHLARRFELIPDGPVEVPLRGRLPALQAERGGRRLDGRAPPLHGAQARARGAARERSGRRRSRRPTTWS